jgi:putative superfamily III holin-X
VTNDGIKPPESADKSLGEIVGDVSEQASQLVREEIELAKAEVQQKLSRIARGAAAGAAAGVFVLFGLIYFFHGLALFLDDLLDADPWVGYAIVTGGLFLLAALAGLLALRLFKTGAPPTPDLAIEEAKLTREALEETTRRREHLGDSLEAGEALDEARR